jgi:hypothetical protein
MGNSLWKIETGWLSGYTEDRELIRRLKRYKPHWTIQADYFKNGRLIGCQFKIPIEERRPAERMLGTAVNQEN